MHVNALWANATVSGVDRLPGARTAASRPAFVSSYATTWPQSVLTCMP